MYRGVKEGHQAAPSALQLLSGKGIPFFLPPFPRPSPRDSNPWDVVILKDRPWEIVSVLLLREKGL